MKRIFNSFSRRSSPVRDSPSYPEDSPEGIVQREVAAFCESGGPNSTHGNEFVHLPGIVESAESSPNAAREAASRIRKLLSDPNRTPSNVQYNAIMLIRILIDNPGHTFSRNIDATFVTTVKDLLRQGKDANVHNFLRETLDALELERSWDEDLKLLLGMWSKEKGKSSIRTGATPGWAQPLVQPYRQTPNYFNAPNQNGSLPSPEELSARISEAKTSAKLLIQFVQSTPPAEMLENELIKEFSDRCRTASRAVQNYIHSTNPTPDEDTLVTLIETNDELSVALSKHQHALLQARRAQGQSGSQSPASSSQASASGSVQPPLPQAPPVPPRDTQSLSSGSSTAPVAPTLPRSYSNGAGRYEYRSEDFQVQNPFADSSGTATPPVHGDNPRGEGSSADWWAEGHQQQRPVQHF
ncbi:GAT domain-containing protein [Aspergillus sclerotioniger CBS 115572]|uniref:GAT domain-containing protein n=1 Tax=Aspergillus sclerotioniger CBS 115572 TaxID=1450535 RepID=A0A317WWD9_9EURO|nr:GAT domain-containing protein [Aspergillus sclerotioniger CBS 115572]PWY88630.1 GAT domain-containing protein [Aspergillus sclerotioniger CBS 115572]